MRPLSLAFGLVADPRDASAMMLELRAGLLRSGSLSIEPVYLPTHASLYEAMEAGVCDVAWTPPLVAFDLLRCGAAEPVVTTVRDGQTTYYSALVVRADSPLCDIVDLAGARVGWVSKQSAAGYVVPRRYLVDFGLDRVFRLGSESVLGSHARAAEALAEGEVDVVATYAAVSRLDRSVRLAPMPCDARAIALAGPIPNDVIAVRGRLDRAATGAIRSAFLDLEVRPDGELHRVTRAHGFQRVPRTHLDRLRALFDIVAHESASWSD